MEQNNISLLSLSTALWSRRWTILLITGISIAAAAVMVVNTPPTYTASATLVIDFNNAVGNQLDTKSTLAAALQENYLTTQLGIIESRHVAAKVVDNLGLESDPSWRDLFVERTGGTGSARDWIARALLTSLTVSPGKNSRLVNVDYTAKSPEMAAMLANGFARAYEETNLEMSTQPARKEATQFERTLQELRENLVQSQRMLGKYQQKHGILLTDERLDLETERLKELLTQRIQAETEARALAGKLRRVEDSGASKESLSALPEVLDNDVVRDLKRELATKRAEFAEVRRKFGKNHPHYTRTAAEVATLRGQLAGEMSSIASGIQNEIEQGRNRAEAYLNAENAQEARVMELKQARDQLSALMREQENAQKSYDHGLQRYNQFMMQSRLSQTNVTLLSTALVPTQAASPNLKRSLALAGLLGLALGFAYTTIREVLDRRVRSVADLEELSDGAFLGSLPHRG